MNETQTITKVKRLLSLDALRGFNMFWIVGAEPIADALNQLNFPGAGILAGQLNHADWNGFTFYDLIYPMFIFVVGVSTVFSIKRRQEREEAPLKILYHIFTRTALLFLLGLFLSNSGLNLHGWLTNLRWMGVLQRIALCYCGAAFLVLYTKRWHQGIITGTLLIGYWLLLRFVPVPGHGPGVLNTPGMNFANYFDRLFLPGRLYYHTWEVEGLLSTFPALATCLGGVFTGYWLRDEGRFRGKLINPKRKAVILAVAGVSVLGLGLLWALDFPINKKIWTSSYVLLTGGLSAMAMALFYWLIDIRGYKRWTFPFVVIGANSIFIYLAANIIPFDKISDWLTGGRLPGWFGAGSALGLAIISLAIQWLILYIMFKRKIFIRL
jgi:predicted acyltransferase